MNNRFKFRIYSFLDKSFHYFSIGDGETGYPQGIAGGVSEIQQYTGLNDKNGNLIFEGDIVERGNLKYLVEWESNKWQARASEFGKQKNYGLHNTPEEAHAVWAARRNVYVQEVAEMYKGRIRDEVYQKLKAYSAS